MRIHPNVIFSVSLEVNVNITYRQIHIDKYMNCISHLYSSLTKLHFYLKTGW